MPEPLTTLPGDIPGLLRRGSPIVYVGPDRRRHGWIGLIEQVYPDGQARIAWNAGVHGVERLGHVALDLTDATGRSHAAWWASANGGIGDGYLAAFAFGARDMTPEQIDALCRRCLRLPGRAS